MTASRCARLDAVVGDVRHQRAHRRMARVAGERGADLAAPPGQLGGGDAGVGDLVGDVVDLAAEGIEGGDRGAPRRRQEQEGVVEARAARGGLFLDVLLGRRHGGAYERSARGAARRAARRRAPAHRQRAPGEQRRVGAADRRPRRAGWRRRGDRSSRARAGRPGRRGGAPSRRGRRSRRRAARPTSISSRAQATSSATSAWTRSLSRRASSSSTSTPCRRASARGT